MIDEFDSEFFEAQVKSFYMRCEDAKKAGGIAAKDVLDGTSTIPEGWKLDLFTQYYLPEKMILS